MSCWLGHQCRPAVRSFPCQGSGRFSPATAGRKGHSGATAVLAACGGQSRALQRGSPPPPASSSPGTYARSRPERPCSSAQRAPPRPVPPLESHPYSSSSRRSPRRCSPPAADARPGGTRRCRGESLSGRKLCSPGGCSLASRAHSNISTAPQRLPNVDSADASSLAPFAATASTNARSVANKSMSR